MYSNIYLIHVARLKTTFQNENIKNVHKCQFQKSEEKSTKLCQAKKYKKKNKNKTTE